MRLTAPESSVAAEGRPTETGRIGRLGGLAGGWRGEGRGRSAVIVSSNSRASERARGRERDACSWQLEEDGRAGGEAATKDDESHSSREWS